MKNRGNRMRSNYQSTTNQGASKCYYSTQYEFRQLNTAALQSTQPYQRKVRAERVQEIIDNFNPLYLDEIIVSFRDGKYWVVDGQNRVAAFKQMNGNKHCTVNCKIFTGLTYQDEAEMFHHLDKIRGKLKHNERVQARREAGDPDIQNVERIISGLKLRWKLDGAGAGSDGVIACSKVPLDCYEKYGPHVLDIGLRLIVRTFGPTKEALTATFIKGACLFAHVYAKDADEDMFIKKVSQYTTKEIKTLAKHQIAVNRQDVKYARTFWDIYNKDMGKNRLEYRLPE